MTLAEAARVVRGIHETTPSFTARVGAISAHFVGTPYKLNPLGEGQNGKTDKDPTFDLAHVDCLTLIETVLALAHTPELGEAKALLQHIRYAGGRIAWAQRHHFAESQWLPENQRLGVLKDVTRKLGGAAVVDSTKMLGAASWRGKWARWKRRLGERTPRGNFTLPVLPLDDAIRLAERFPLGAILTVVRVDKANVPTRISHQGIVIKKGRRRFLRHASSGPRFRRVIDYPLASYFRFSKRYFKTRWPVMGVNVQLPTRSDTLLGKRTAGE